MRGRWMAIALLLALSAAGCESSCGQLVSESCAKNGEESLTCITRGNELAEASGGRDRLCERCLMLYRSLPERGSR